MRRRQLELSLIGTLALSAGCGQQPGAQIPAQPAAIQNTATSLLLGGGKIRHVVIIFQENRTPDNLFQGLRGADTVRNGKNSRGQVVKLRPISLTAPYDISHKHDAYATEYDDGKLDGFNNVASLCKKGAHCPAPGVRAYGYVPRHEVEPYFTMAESYVFADHMFQTNQGPSLPAHQYILSGTSTIVDGSPLRAAENGYTPERKFTGGCDSPPGSQVWLINPAGEENREIYPCFERQALIDSVEAKRGLTWRYYQHHVGPGLWSGPDAIKHIRNSPAYRTHVVGPSSRVLTDIAGGKLANVVWVIPSVKSSDHAGQNDGSGPSWVASVVNAIGKSQYWDNTAIFVTWDDWGGWYDHVKPQQLNSYELGFRVPLIVISAYARKGFISHRRHEFGSILKFAEKVLGLDSLGTTDVRSDDLSDCFNFARPPRKFKIIPAALPPSYFLNSPPSTEEPDDDF
ncbi:MAG TPA: alkaline phosphatase family protein [Candidatus Binatia bacterium]|nr:alkaline phosphatase family protein [Candidatus Binatia bacterium]